MCGVEVEEISRDTDPEHALCRKDGTWAKNSSINKEDVT